MMKLLLIIGGAVALAPTVVQFSDHSGAVMPIGDGKDAAAWVALALSNRYSGFHKQPDCPPHVRCFKDPRGSDGLAATEPVPNPAWERVGRLFFLKGTSETGKAFGRQDSMHATWLERRPQTDVTSTRLLDVAGYVGLAPWSLTARKSAFRLVRHPDRADWMTLLPGTGEESATLTSAVIKAESQLAFWTLSAAISFEGRSYTSKVRVVVDFDVRETRLPRSLVQRAGLEVVQDATGREYIGCSVFDQDGFGLVRFAFDADNALIVPIGRVTSTPGCRSDILVVDGPAVRLGYAFFSTFDELVFDARPLTVTVRTLSSLPVLPQPKWLFAQVPFYQAHALDESTHSAELRLTRAVDFTGPRYLLTRVVHKPERRIVFVRHPHSPKDTIGVQVATHIVSARSEVISGATSLAVRSLKQASGGFTLRVETLHSTLVVETSPNPTELPQSIDSALVDEMVQTPPSGIVGSTRAVETVADPTLVPPSVIIL